MITPVVGAICSLIQRAPSERVTAGAAVYFIALHLGGLNVKALLQQRQNEG